MEPLYETTEEITLEEYVRFAKTIYWKDKHGVAWLIFAELLLLFADVIQFREGNSTFALPLLIFIIVFPIVLKLILDRSLKKTYESNQLLNGYKMTIRFFEDHYEGCGENGSLNYPYAKLAKIIETNTNFYLMIGDNQGTLITKERCTPELIAFLQGLKA